MYIRGFMMGSTAETPLAKPELHGLMAWLLSHTFRIRLIMIPVRAFLQASINMIVLCFSILTVLSIFSIGNMASRFHESGVYHPARAAFAMYPCMTRAFLLGRTSGCVL